MLRAILVDDETESLLGLAHDLAKICPELEIIGKYDEAKEAVKAIARLKPEILFLDIDMPYINGFDLLEMLPDSDFEVIFTTAHDEYALKAFRISAVDYLLKPINKKDLKTAVDKVIARRGDGKTGDKIRYLLEQVKDIEQNNVERIVLPTRDSIHFVHMDKILYCQSDGSYCNIHFLDGSRLYISKNLRYMEDTLSPYYFYRVHNSYIVNINEINKYIKSDGGSILLSSGEKVPVSRSRKKELLSLF